MVVSGECLDVKTRREIVVIVEKDPYHDESHSCQYRVSAEP
jgi:hypothetical protein